MKRDVEAFLMLVRDDIGSAKMLLDRYPGNAAFLVEQAAEKLIKAVLAQEDIREGTRHRQLGQLVELLPDDHRWRSDLAGFDKLSEAATVFRYPRYDGSVPEPPGPEELKEALAEIERLLPPIEDWCRSA